MIIKCILFVCDFILQSVQWCKNSFQHLVFMPVKTTLLTSKAKYAASAVLVVAGIFLSAISLSAAENTFIDAFDAYVQSPHCTECWWRKANFEEMIAAIDRAYQVAAREGYIIRCDEHGPQVIPQGGRRMPGVELSGVPSSHPDDCSFCNPKVPSVQEFQDCRLIASRSNTPLLIPSNAPIPIHWFQADKLTKIALLQAMQTVLDRLHGALPGSKFYCELHCGAPAAQTVWHLHLRIHRVQGWNQVDWQSFFN